MDVRFPMRITLIATFLLAFAQLAVGQCPPKDALTVRVSADGICYFLETSTPCAQLGRYLSKHRAQFVEAQLEIDEPAKQEVVQATLKSLKRAGFKFKKYGCVSNEFF
jgi:hypothetical protein